MKLSKMSVKQVSARGLKKLISELTSVKFWAACFIGYLNYDLVMETGKFDTFGIMAFLALLGIREISDFASKKEE